MSTVNAIQFSSVWCKFEDTAGSRITRHSTIREWTSLRVAIDTGGTFTDCVYLAGTQLKVLKVFSTPADPSLAVLHALQQIGAREALDVRHGTTVGTNAMLERKGARVAFVTTAGFEDTIAIGRQTRSKLYDWFAPVPVCLVPRELRFGVPERVSSSGEILRSPTDEELEELVSAVGTSAAQSVALSLLFSFANPETELRVEAALGRLNIPVSISHRILPEFREFERASTVVVNAYLAPAMQDYLLRLEQRVTSLDAGSRVHVMQSSGGIIPARLAAGEPVRTVLSGPAGGVIGACQAARWVGIESIVGFDMGGTSTDVFLANATSDGPQRTNEAVVAGVPVSIPMLDIHTAGAGGGSIARFDAGGMLRELGPSPAGTLRSQANAVSDAGTMPTVTDANLLLGRLDPDSFLGGGVSLDTQRTRALMNEQKGPLRTAEEFAAGILRVVETQMEKAIRVISVERGYDPRQFTLVAFGGGGPLHACSLARSLRIRRVLIPAMPGALSAVGILLADTVRDYSRTVMLPVDAIAAIEENFAELEQRGAREFSAEGLKGTGLRTADMRYRRQGYELNVVYSADAPRDTVEAFHRLHQQRYGFSDASRPVEIVNVRLRVIAAATAYSPPRKEGVQGEESVVPSEWRQVYFDGRFLPTRLYRREALTSGARIHGPALITEYTSATALPPDSWANVDEIGNLVIELGQVRT